MVKGVDWGRGPKKGMKECAHPFSFTFVPSKGKSFVLLPCRASPPKYNSSWGRVDQYQRGPAKGNRLLWTCHSGYSSSGHASEDLSHYKSTCVHCERNHNLKYYQKVEAFLQPKHFPVEGWCSWMRSARWNILKQKKQQHFIGTACVGFFNIFPS